MNRRQLIKNFSAGGACLTGMAGWPLLGRFLEGRALAETAFQPRFLSIFLGGGWDSHLATDPIIGARSSSAAFEPVYQTLATSVVPGKPNLRVGAGLIPAIDAFANLPTAFVNGIFSEVTAHELASAYMQSGVLSLTRSREFPCLTAVMGEAAGAFPAHVVLGNTVPLGSTKDSAPPLHSQSADTLATMLKGSRAGDLNPKSIDVASTLLAKLDERFAGTLTTEGKTKLNSWIDSSQRINTLYTSDFGNQVSLTDPIRERYSAFADWEVEALLACSWLCLKSGLSPFISVSFAGFDTHSNHMGQHPKLLEKFARALKILVQDLRNTPDPQDSERSLADTTTVLISSEFVRTPTFNVGGGTDHWPSASAIVMGRGVRDNQVIGRTGLDAKPLGWASGQEAPLVAETKLLPEHLAASVLAHLGFSNQAKSISAGGIDDLFV